MSKKYTLPSALLMLFSSAVFADGLFLDSLEQELGLTESLSSIYALDSKPKQRQFNGDECRSVSRQEFAHNGLTSGGSSTHCFVNEFHGGKVESYFHSNPDGSYTNGLSWTFE